MICLRGTGFQPVVHNPTPTGGSGSARNCSVGGRAPRSDRQWKHRLEAGATKTVETIAVIVVKVGGSLFDHPRLGPGLRTYLDSLAPAKVLLVPGGGDVVEAVRKLDRVHGLGEEASHRVALESLWVTAALLRELLPETGCFYACHPDADKFASLPPGTRRILDAHGFCQLTDSTLPHSWDVTSDSIAARVAIVYGAERLVLLKSVDVPAGTSWEDTATRGWVDAHFPRVVAGAALTIEVVNFRRVLDSLPA